MARATNKSKISAPVLLISTDEDFIERMKSIVSRLGSRLGGRLGGRSGIESVGLTPAELSPSGLEKNRHAAVVDCRSDGEVGLSVIDKLHNDHKTMPILAVIKEDSCEKDLTAAGAGAVFYVSESAGPQAMEQMVRAMLRMKEYQDKIARLEHMLNHSKDKLKDISKERDEYKLGLAKRVQEQITVYRASRAMFRVFDFDALANEVVQLASAEIGAETGSLMLIEGEDLVVRALFGNVPGEDRIMGQRQKVGEGISGWVAREGKPLLITDIDRHPKFSERGGARYKSKSFVSSPIIARGRIRGVINLTNKVGGGQFTEDDLRLLRILAMTAAAALDIFELIDRIQRVETMSSIGELATRMAHEIRNPLHAIKITIQILGKKFQFSEGDREYYDILIGEINRLEGLVHDVLIFAREEQLKIANCDVNKVLDRTLTVLKSQLDEKGIDLETSWAENLPQVRIDEAKIEQAFINLIVNASEALDPGGKIKISTQLVTPFIVPLSQYGEEIEEPPDSIKFVRITVSDNGPGIEEHLAHRIFTPFFTTKVHGTGLGLSTSRKIVEAHSGKLNFESTPGEGATFWLSLPIKE